jgi:hypothetical protein
VNVAAAAEKIIAENFDPMRFVMAENFIFRLHED